MVSPAVSDPSPFFLPGGNTGILLIHGFTATPSEMSYIGGYLHQKGLTVSASLLPGHGTTPEDCNRYRWQHWANHVTIAFAELQDRCNRVFIGGFSMGALLALYLGAKLSRIEGIILYAPAIKAANKKQFLSPALKYFKRSIDKPDVDLDPEIKKVRWAYDVYPTKAANEFSRLQREVKSLLPAVSVPLLVIYSTEDRTVRSAGVDYLLKKVGSNEKEVVTLNNSGHIITLDKEKERVAKRSFQFIEKYEGSSRGGSSLSLR